MILRNPALWRDSFFIRMLLVFLAFFPTTRTVAQGIHGTVLEQFSRQPVAGAVVRVSMAGAPLADVITDSLGRYACSFSSAGRVSIEINATGFDVFIIGDIMADGYSTLRLEHLIERSSFDLPAVTVTALSRRRSAFVRSIQPGDMVLVAGNFEDPVRIGLSQPGIVLLNDQTNQLSARGKSPLLNSWYLEGLEIVNPNHTNNAGTFSDRPTQSGGGVNLFSNQILGQTDIYTGLNPMSIGRHAGAVIDFHLHESARSEFRAKAGLIGMEFGGAVAGPSSVLDFNLRYSFTGILTGLGADFGGEKIGFYDGVASYTLTGQRHKLKVFAWGGGSENRFEKVEALKDRTRFKDFFDIDFENDMYGTGARYDLRWDSTHLLRTGISYSRSDTRYRRSGVFETDTIFQRPGSIASVLSAFAEFSNTFSGSLRASVGLQYVNRWYRNLSRFFPLSEEFKIRPYLEAVWKISPSLAMEFGAELSHGGRNLSYSDNRSNVPGFRGVLKWNTTTASTFFAGYTRTAGHEVIGGADEGNQIRVEKMEAGWLWSNSRHALSFDAYYHLQRRLSVNLLWPEGYIHLADIYDPGYEIQFDVNNDGEARQFGLEGQWDYTGSNGWRFSLNQTVYRSQRGLQGEALTGGRFDGRFASHLTVSREIVRQKKERQRTWNFSLRGLLHGGLREEAISPEFSDEANTTVFIQPGSFVNRLPEYKRLDMSIARTIAYTKVRWRYSLDIQNLAGWTNVAYHYYDPFLKEVIAQEQLGIIPVLSVQAFW